MAKVLLALSGGIDSTVAAYLLKANYDVAAVTLQLTADDECIDKAALVAKHLGIKHIVLDWQGRFAAEVIEPFKKDYFKALTPNPCIICNQSIKFGALLDYALEHGYEYLATGHYVRKVMSGDRYYLAKAKTFRRDQSYYLYHLSSSQLEKILFPLGEFGDKAEVLTLYEKLGLPMLSNAESRGICFTNGQYYGDWLSTDELAVGTGEVYDSDGAYRGQHKGFYHYTIGQKRLEGVKMTSDECILALDAAANKVIVGAESLVYSKFMRLDQVNYCQSLKVGEIIVLKMFNWGLDLKAEIKALGEEIALEFLEPVRAIALGQYAVAYKDDLLVLGGRIIAKNQV